MKISSFGFRCLNHSLYCLGAPEAFPGLLSRSYWPTLQKFITLQHVKVIFPLRMISIIPHPKSRAKGVGAGMG